MAVYINILNGGDITVGAAGGDQPPSGSWSFDTSGVTGGYAEDIKSAMAEGWYDFAWGEEEDFQQIDGEMQQVFLHGWKLCIYRDPEHDGTLGGNGMQFSTADSIVQTSENATRVEIPIWDRDRESAGTIIATR